MTLSSPIPGLKQEQAAEVFDLLRSCLAPRQKLRLWLFGSRATGAFRPYSDVDLLLEDGDGSLTDRQLYAMRELLEESNLPYKFDLVNSADLADTFRSKIDREKIELTEAL